LSVKTLIETDVDPFEAVNAFTEFALKVDKCRKCNPEDNRGDGHLDGLCLQHEKEQNELEHKYPNPNKVIDI